MSTDRAEQDLITEAISGDRAALERLLLVHYNGLWNEIAAKLPTSLQSAVSVEDVLQETFIHAFRDIGSFEPVSERSFAGWLKAIAKNRLRDAIKALTRKKRGGNLRRVRGPVDAQAGSVADLVEIICADDHTPSQSAARHEGIEAVQVAMAGLPDDYREAIRLLYLEGKSLNEVAAEMDRSPGAIRGLLTRAKEKMRAALGRSSLYLSGE